MRLTKGGWSIRRRGEGRVWTVRYTLPDGTGDERSTGAHDREAALAEGARIYADAVRRAESSPVAVRQRRLVVDFPGALALWLASLVNTHAKITLGVWEGWASHWIEYFGELHNITSGTCKDWVSSRLAKVKRQSVKRELAALRSFIRFAHERGLIPELVQIANAPRQASGTACAVRRRVAALPLTVQQVEAFLAALPETSEAPDNRADVYPVRDRFRAQYETGLRPSTMDRIRTPEHYRPGESALRLSDETDKARWGRDVPLTPQAQAALDRALAWIEEQRRAKAAALGRPAPTEPYAGPIFGAHDYRKPVRKAARAVLPAELAARFCAAHLRSARITHLLERGANIVGVQYSVGHKQLSTTNKYVRPTFRAAVEAMGVMGNPDPTTPAPACVEQAPNVIPFPKVRSASNG
jgi:site-specific recombinase XerD